MAHCSTAFQLVTLSFGGVLSKEGDYLNWIVYVVLRTFNVLAVLAILVLMLFFVGTKRHLLTWKNVSNFIIVSIMGEETGKHFTISMQLRRWRVKLEEPVDCPICLIRMEKGEEVVALPCNKLHAYHETCALSLHQNSFSKCALCRAPIEF